MSSSQRLPAFALDEYASLIGTLLHNGYVFRRVEDMVDSNSSLALFLRHDIDIHIPGIERMASVEAQLGVSATYYVPLTLPFNPFYPENAAILREIVAMGHSLGLHYDLADYPHDEAAARARLDREVLALGELTGMPPRTICMHVPSLRGEDRFRGIDDYVNPHDPRYGADLLYISDSCRAWRDEELLRCFGANPPRRVLLNTHPELWLGRAEEDRQSFLEGPLLDRAVSQTRAYLLDELGAAWQVHPGPAAEDARTIAHRV